MSSAELPAIEFRRLSFRYPNGRLALEEIAGSVPRGERVAIVGPSGAGKSTLLMHLNGLLPSTAISTDEQAQVLIEGQEVTRSRLQQIRRQVGFLFQDPDDQLFCPTVRDDVAFGPLNLGLPRAEVLARVESGLAAVGMSDCSNRNPSELSTGERKRVCLAGILACQPSILVLDEPTSNLDPRARRTLLEILRAFTGTLIVATHDLDFVIDLCSRVLVLESGKIQADGTTQRILSDPLIMDRHGLEVPWRFRK
jgi:energy-coupling factor transporter ATP-binding protein EcfA2